MFSPRKNKLQWYHIYYILAILDVITICSSLYLNHDLTQKYNSSVEQNTKWTDRVWHLSQLARIGAKVNAPSNDIFISEDVKSERKRLQTSFQQFRDKMKEIRCEFYEHGVFAEYPYIWQDLRTVDRRMLGMFSEATDILDLYESGKKDLAIQKMAVMDKHHYYAMETLISLRQHITEVQQTLLKKQSADVEQMRMLERCIAAALVVMIIAITFYGFRLARIVQIDTALQAERVVQLEQAKTGLENKTQELQNALQHLETAQEQLSQSEQKFRAIFDHTFQFIGLMKPNGKLLEVNKTALDFINAKRESVVGKYFWDTPWWNHAPELQDQLKEAVTGAAKGQFVRFEATHPRFDGECVSVDFSLKPVIDEAGTVIMLIPEGRDISEKKLAEQRISEFYSTVSHELRTPLTAIRGSLAVMEGGLAGKLPSKAMTLVQIASTESDRLIRLINDILDLRKIEAGMLELNKDAIETTLLVQRTIENLTSIADAAEIGLKSDFEYEGKLCCDEDRILQVLTNLVSNAIKFSEKNATVKIVVTAPAPQLVRFSVQDEGSGIAPELAHKLFNRFQQIDQSDRRKKGGTGLGLAISKAIVEQHGGTIGVSSQQAKGSTFWFELPNQGTT